LWELISSKLKEWQSPWVREMSEENEPLPNHPRNHPRDPKQEMMIDQQRHPANNICELVFTEMIALLTLLVIVAFCFCDALLEGSKTERSMSVVLWAIAEVSTIGLVPISACIRLYHGKTLLIWSKNCLA
jgi:hypothetical protein